MAKKILQDVLPPENKSIRNIPLSRKRRGGGTHTSTEDIIVLDSRKPLKKNIEPAHDNYFSPSQKTQGKFPHKSVWITGVLCLLVVGFVFSFLFVSAEVEITTKTQTVDIKAPLVAKKSPESLDLGFQTVTLSKVLGKTVEAKDEEQIDKKASGRIVIFNKNSKTTQRLITGTRFQTSSGLIYKIDSAVIVPGYSTKAGEIVAGSITATVTAEKAGTDYNIPLSDFTIPGFKGDPKFTNIFARSDTPMQGGFSGKVKKITSSTLSKTEDELKAQLKDQLIIEVKSQIPDNFILYPNATFFTFESAPQTDTKDTSVTVNQKGTISGIILDENVLNRELASNTKLSSKEGEVYVSNLSDLEFVLPPNVALPISGDKDIPFILKGQAHFVWIFDQEQIKKNLVGKSKKELGSVISSYPAIASAKANITPFWNMSFPSKTSKISFKVTTQ
ncbi:hypothetical protein EXS61_00525 [Candidatus Parcubacteria bacterium]|nr:hypothetical protein [Candidatus Parcubacteria bacterium]